MKPHDDKDNSDEGLRDLVLQALDDPKAPLSDDEMAALLTGGASPEERGALVDRLVQDDHAVQQMQTLRPLDSWSKKATEAVNASPTLSRWMPRSRSRMGALALAASLLLAVGWAVFWPRLQGPPVPSTTRGILLQEVVYEPADGTRITTVPEVFRWTLPATVDEDADVQMLLFDDHTELLWKSPKRQGGELPLPAELRSQLKSGGTFFWRLSIDDGLEKHLTFLAQFEIKP